MALRKSKHKSGLNKKELKLLCEINAHQWTTPSEAFKTTGIRRSTGDRIIKELKARGLARNYGAIVKHEVAITITDYGREVAATANN